MLENKEAEQDRNPDVEFAEKKAAELMEICDSVQIIMTKHDPLNNVTLSISIGRGNIYARQAAVREWVLKQDEYSKESARQDAFEE